jgi:hypothetical protein
VKKLDEVEAVECDLATNPFLSELTFGLSITSDISGNILDSVADLVESVFNELIEDYCDPLIRRIQSLKISNYEPSELIGCQNVQLTFGVDGQCRGCDDGAPLLDQENNDGKNKRRLVQSTTSFHEEPAIGSHRRGLKDSNYCFCNKQTIADRAPTMIELEEALERAFEKDALEGVCGLVREETDSPETQAPSSLPTSIASESPTQCTAVLSKEFNSQVVLSVQDKAGLSLTDTDQIGVAIVAAYNELSAVLYSQCDLSYRQISSIELNADFASRNLESITRHRKIQGDPGDILIFAVVGICEDCSPESDLLDVVSSTDLLSRVSDAISIVLGAGQLYWESRK